jgi:hypothetical protein
MRALVLHEPRPDKDGRYSFALLWLDTKRAEMKRPRPGFVGPIDALRGQEFRAEMPQCVRRFTSEAEAIAYLRRGA